MMPFQFHLDPVWVLTLKTSIESVCTLPTTSNCKARDWSGKRYAEPKQLRLRLHQTGKKTDTQVRSTHRSHSAGRPSNRSRHRRVPIACVGHTGVCAKNTLLRRTVLLGRRLSEHQIRGWIAVSAEGLQGEGSPKTSVVFHRHRCLVAGRALEQPLRSFPPRRPAKQCTAATIPNDKN